MASMDGAPAGSNSHLDNGTPAASLMSGYAREWDLLPLEWKEIFKKNLVFQRELVTEQRSQSKFAARYYDMDTYWQVFFPDRDLDLSIDDDELRHLLGLRKLKCGGTKIDSLEVIERLGLTGIEYLDCNHTEIRRLDEVSGLEGLRTLEIEYTHVSDLAPLRSCTGLEQLYFSHTGVEDMAPIASLSALVNLDLNDTAVSDLSPLRDLPHLQTLVMNGSRSVGDLRPLGSTQALVKLDISRTGVTSLADLAAHRDLQILVAGELDIRSIEVVNQLPALESLYINNTTNRIDLDPLRGCTSLRALYIGGTEVFHVDALLELQSLEILFHSDLDESLCSEIKAARPRCAITQQ